MTSLLPIIAVCAVILVVAYLTYGRLVARWLGVDPARRTPAVEYNDGRDFVPAPAGVVLGGHFTAIAAAGPIVGPILAGLAFGWAPALVWILVGSIFIGGVHDASSLLASLRHKATTITQIVREHMSWRAYITFLLFVWLSLVYVIIAFADLTASSFAKLETVPIQMQEGVRTFTINGGAVAIGATAYLALSVALGVVLRFTRVPWWAGLVGCAAALAAVIAYAPDWAIWLDRAGLGFLDVRDDNAAQLTRTWDLVLLAYCFAASITPMWALLQPRGLIGATFLYAALAFGVVGVVVGGLLTHDPSLTINWDRAFSGFWGGAGGGASLAGQPLFPFLFITVACGACSGFHAVVCSGTTCKQVRNEGDIRPVAYGGMLLEAMVALFALSCVMVLASDARGGTPDSIFARGIGNFMRICGIPLEFAISFGLLAFSSFVFDTLDVCTRLGRYVFQELTGLKGLAGGAAATLITLAGPALYLWSAEPGAWKTFWVIFGSSNQLLAALTLLAVSVWLWRTGRPVWFALAPAAVMLASTFTALVINFRTFWVQYGKLAADASHTPQVLNMAIAAVLLGLGGLVAYEAVKVWKLSRTIARTVAAEAA